MTFSPMPNDDFTPLPQEAEKYFNVYIDETSQTKYRYLLIGGLVVPISHAAQFEADISCARINTVAPIARPDGTPRVLKWQKLGAYNFDVYKKVVDIAFNFRRLHKLPISKDVAVHTVCVDTSIRPLKVTGDGDIGIGFDKEFYFLCTVVMARRYREALFALYPDRRHPSRTMRENRDMMNRGAAKYGDKRDYPFRRLIFADPERCQALQIVDIIIGGIAYKLNGHYDRPDANQAKRDFCDYLFGLFKLTDIFYQSQWYRTDFFTLTLRPKPPYRARRFPPKQ